ncbi:MAG: UDP-N-acetylglucosamine--N-acetylmuramyl-(pentapeptide) pyrophosphoryl-undecaprenol N-acetylglucosamine transferase [Clostridia bacterium]|nr:UDP-N-acetylglucosamine--N-acetylmuramyl-(pentapeptide) pyrophosphoryl-undecaprenol N-acetylglucosamine transferase [Clostridia bacterium]
MNIALTGGGTAGHIMPNIALAEALGKYFERIVYLGSSESMEEAICKERNIPYYPTETRKFVRGKIWKNLLLPEALIRGTKQAKKVLAEKDVDIIFSKGGYVSMPAVLAARSLSLPVVCHESDRTLGLANRVTAHFAARVYTAFPGTCKKGIVMPTPIRSKIFHGERMHLFESAKPVVLFMGGSLGAKAINDALSSSLADLTAKYNVLHIGGRGTLPMKTTSYVSVPYADDIENYFATADVIVSRGGASTLGELTALGKKVLVIPLPKGTSRGDQVLNAAYYLKEGLVSVLPQESLTTDNLLGAIARIIKKHLPAPAYARDTAEILARELYDVALTSREEKERKALISKK